MNIRTGILLLVGLAFGVAACHKDKVEACTDGKLEETSCVSFVLHSDYSVNEVVLTRAGEHPADADFNVRLENTRAEILRTWKYAELPSLIKVVPGSYKLVAYYGSDTLLPAFDTPYYYGETKVTLHEGDNLDTIVKTSVGTVKVALDFDESFSFDYDDYFVDVKTVGDSLRFLKTETREGYFLPGSLRMRFGLKPKGSTEWFEFYPAALKNVKAKEFYRMTLKAQCENGALSKISIKTDSTTIDIPVDVKLPAVFLPKAAPEVTLSADEMEGESILTTEGVSKKARVAVSSAGGLTELKIKTVSDTLLARGWPAEFDLMKATEAQKAILKANGLVWSRNIDEQDTIRSIAWIQFDDVVKLLSTAPGKTAVSAFEVLAKDRFAQEGDKRFDVKVAPPVFEFVNDPGEGNVWAKRALYDVKYVSERETPVVECQGADGNWKTLETTLTEKNADEYECLAKGLTPATAYAFRVRLGGHTLDAGNYVTEVDAQVPNSGFEEWYTDSKSQFSIGTFSKFTWYFYYPYAAQTDDEWWATNNAYSQAWTAAPVEVTTCPAVIYVNDAKFGNKAAEIHTIGAGGEYASTNSIIYPESACAGRLFIGNYSWENKKDVVTEGHRFDSRPLSMAFWYKYIPYNTDQFQVEIELRNNDVVIATGKYVSASVGNADEEYREAVVDLQYTNWDLKATAIYINILSTTKTEFTKDDLQKAGKIELTDCASSWTTHLGSRLRIDGITLMY